MIPKDEFPVHHGEYPIRATNWQHHWAPNQPIRIVVGGQWGSEAKGAVAAFLCEKYNINYAVRTGGVNAGHTVYYKGMPYKMQQLPTGWVNPGTQLVIGPGAYVNKDILNDEMRQINEIEPYPEDNEVTRAGIAARVLIDPRAGTHYSYHTDKSTRSGRHHYIGATGKGCSEAVMDRIRLRGKIDPTDGVEGILYGGDGPDTERLLNDAYDAGRSILLEGTQGQLLDILLGPWPYTTHKPTSPAQWLVETGLSPKLNYEVVMVARVYPIRVAGNSGPMPNEIRWEDLAQYINFHLQACKPGTAQWVAKEALNAWGEAQAELGDEWLVNGKLPSFTDYYRPNYRFESWSPAMRLQYAEAVSEFHKEALSRMSGEHVAELSNLFEFTTVTKKLRRIARWDYETMEASTRQIRPDYIVLTFLNYRFPELWGSTTASDVANNNEAMMFIAEVQRRLKTWVRYVSTGPESKHILEVPQI